MHQIGAIFYVVWGGLHLLAAVQVWRLGSGMSEGMARARVFQSAWNLAFLATLVSLVAVVLNWQNSPTGYWLNLALASATDIGFIVLILAPGYLPLWPGSVGPALWLLATTFSTLGMLGAAA